MNTGRLEMLFNRVATNVEAYRQSEKLYVQFTCPWRFDRPADELKSAVELDCRGRVQEATIRPGPLPKTEIVSQEHAVDVISDALTNTELNSEIDITVKDYGNQYYRPHVELSGIRADTLSDWLDTFINTYKVAYENIGVDRKNEYEPSQPKFTCVYCEKNKATCIFEVQGTLNPKLSCEKCARDQTVGVSLPNEEKTMWPESSSMSAKFPLNIPPLWLRGAAGLYIREPNGEYVLYEESNVNCFSYFSTSDHVSP